MEDRRAGRESPLKQYIDAITLEAEHRRVTVGRARKLQEKYQLSEQDHQRLGLITQEALDKAAPLIRRGNLNEALSILREARNINPLAKDVHRQLSDVFLSRWEQGRKRIDEKETLAHLEACIALASGEQDAEENKELKRLYRQRKRYLRKNSPYRDRRILPLMALFLLLLAGTLLWVNRSSWVPPVKNWLAQWSPGPFSRGESRETSPGAGQPGRPPRREELTIQFSPPSRQSPLEYHPRRNEIIRGEDSYSLRVEGFFLHPSQGVDSLRADLIAENRRGEELFRHSSPVVTEISPRYRPGDPLPLQAGTFLRSPAPAVSRLRLEIDRIHTLPPGDYPEETEIPLYGPGEKAVRLLKRRERTIAGVDGDYHLVTLRVENRRETPLTSLPLATQWRTPGGAPAHSRYRDPLALQGPPLYPGDSRILRITSVLPRGTFSSPQWRQNSLFFSTQNPDSGL